MEARIRAIAGVVTVGLFAARGADVILLGTRRRRADDQARPLAPLADVQRCRRRSPRSRYNRRMTNLAVPGLGTFADVGAYMQGVGEAARAAARELARADTRRQERGADGDGDGGARGRRRR